MCRHRRDDAPAASVPRMAAAGCGRGDEPAACGDWGPVDMDIPVDVDVPIDVDVPVVPVMPAGSAAPADSTPPRVAAPVPARASPG